MTAEFRNTLLRWGLEWFGKYYSVYRGEIVDNEDPKFQGRLKLKVPQVYGEDIPEYWAWPRGMFCGKNIGFYAIPELGDTVWVSFENGDPRFPLWEYGWFRENEVSKNAKVDGNKPSNKILQTKSGHRIEFDDKNLLIRVSDSNDNIIELNENGISIISKNISLGKLNESSEPSVLGNTIMTLLNEFRDDIGKLGTIATSTGVTSTINTSPQWASLVTKWDSKWDKFKSKIVNLE